MRLDRPIAAAAIVFAVAGVAACGSLDDPQPSTPAATAGASLTAGSAAAPPTSASARPAPSPAPNPPMTPPSTAPTSPSSAPSPSSPPVPVQAALRVPLHYTPGSDWRVLVDSPNLLELAYEPAWTATEDPPVWANPRVAIGVPVGFDSISAVLKWFRSRPVEIACPELSDPMPTAFGGLTGSGFACSGDSKGSRPLYRVASGHGASIQTSSREVGDGWFLLTNGGYGTTTILFDVHGRPVIATIFGARGHGPAQGEFNRFADTLVLDLDLTFGSRS